MDEHQIRQLKSEIAWLRDKLDNEKMEAVAEKPTMILVLMEGSLKRVLKLVQDELTKRTKAGTLGDLDGDSPPDDS